MPSSSRQRTPFYGNRKINYYLQNGLPLFLSCAKYILFLVVNCFLWPHLILSYHRLTGLPFTHFPLVFDLSPADSLQAWNVKNAIMQFIHYHHHLLLPPLPWCNSPTRVGQGRLISEVSRARAGTHTHTVGRTTLDGWSAQRRYSLTTRNAHDRQTSMPRRDLNRQSQQAICRRSSL